MIYSVEDDAAIRELIVYALRQAGYEAEGFEEGGAFRQALERKTPELVLLDLMLPGLTGEEFITQIRQGKTMPIIVLSAKVAVDDRVNALTLGADDFMTKPFDNREVLARVEAQLRRSRSFSQPQAGKDLRWGPLTLSRDSHTATLDGHEVPLTTREFSILALLMEQPRRAFSRAQIYESVWGEEFMGDENTVNVHVSNLRSKLSKAGPGREYIKTVWGIGFKMAEAE